MGNRKFVRKLQKLIFGSKILALTWAPYAMSIRFQFNFIVK